MHVATETVYKLAHLKNWSNCRPFNGPALAVIGHPIAHSLSPVMHNAALVELTKAHPRFAEWHYFKFDIAPEELKEALDLFHQNNFLGLNLTVPHKALVMEYLDLSIQHKFLREIGAANTLKRTNKGWHGKNTDRFGLSSALHNELHVDLNGKDVILLGAGGAARAAAIECLHNECASLWIGNRSDPALVILLSDLKKSGSLASTTQLEKFSLDNPPPNLPARAVVINATSLGLKPSDKSPLNLVNIPTPAQVFDMIYRPQQTALLRQASEMKIPNANGLSMLVHQGAASLEWWIKEPQQVIHAPVEIMQRAVRAALN